MGSGYVINSLMENVFPSHSIGIGVDLNRKALDSTKAVAQTQLDLILSSLTNCFAKRPLFDIIFCNPPYVPSESLDIIKKSGALIDLAWAGGVDGREVIDKVILCSRDLLNTNGVLYLLLTERNEPDYIVEYARSLGFICMVLVFLNFRMFSQEEILLRGNTCISFIENDQILFLVIKANFCALRYSTINLFQSKRLAIFSVLSLNIYLALLLFWI